VATLSHNGERERITAADIMRGLCFLIGHRVGSSAAPRGAFQTVEILVEPCAEFLWQ
jgi:hypothetical protein